MEAQTGKVVTIVNQDWAIRDSFKPCSTIKLVTGVAGINENLIDDDGKINNSSTRMDLDYALAKSNNAYFQRVGVNMGSSKMIGYAKSLGLGEKTGINADGETAGRLPYGNNNARIYSHGDDVEVTPLQLAVMVSALSNGGKKIVPQISRPRVERTAFRPLVRETVKLPMRSVEGVLPGLIGAAEFGTAHRGVDASMGVAGKTGSCIEKGSWVGLFASVAPIEDPKYSVVVITRGQSERGKYAAAIAGKIYNALGGKIKRNRDLLYARQLKVRPVTPDVSGEADEGEESDIAEAEEADQAPIVVGSSRNGLAGSQPAVPEKKLVQKTTQSKPSFPPVVIEFDKSGAEKKVRPRIVKNK
jgi:membrane peptidoglycan carboxypeptidase